MKYGLKKLIPNSVKSRVKARLLPQYPTFVSNYTKEQRKVIIFLCGYYQNLGDMAITLAQRSFINDTFPEYSIICVPADKTFLWMRAIRSVVGESDIITLTGGGNMSDNYPSLEDARRFVISSFPKNKVISFPQTCDFSFDVLSKQAKRSLKVYSKHKCVTFFARESLSLDRMKRLLPESDVRFCPDTAFLLDIPQKSFRRDGAILCLRDDCESELSVDKLKILNILERICGKVITADTTDISPEACAPENAENSVNGFLETLSKSALVITDRLHCMIFCALTATPCIAFDNANHKISALKEDWLKDVPYIKLLKSPDPDRLEETVRYLSELDAEAQLAVDLKKEFGPLTDALIK